MTLAEHLDKIGKKRYAWAVEMGLQKDAVYRHMAGKAGGLRHGGKT